MVWRSGGAGPAGTLALTAAVADHVPCLESGGMAHPRRVAPETGSWPDWLRSVWRGKEVAWLRRGLSGAAPLLDVRLAARRDEAAGQTLYELAVPVSLLPAAGSADATPCCGTCA